MQDRGRERRDAIIDVAAHLVDELGPDRVTTTLVADRARISVGSIYSYFKDREAIFDAVVARAILTLEANILAVRGSGRYPDFIEGSCAVIDAIVHTYRTTPGFRALWFSQHVSAEMLHSMRTSDEEQVRLLLARLQQQGLRLNLPDPAMALRMYVGLLDKGIDLAFRLDPNGDAAMIEETKRVVRNYLGAHLVPVTARGSKDRSRSQASRPTERQRKATK